jgi:hypothetical protein
VLIKLRSSIDVIRDFIYYELIIIETITVKPLTNLTRKSFGCLPIFPIAPEIKTDVTCGREQMRTIVNKGQTA